MGEHINFLVYILHGQSLLRCAMRVRRDALPVGCEECPMEPENREVIHAMLPDHVRSCGPIVAMEPLFFVHVALDKEGGDGQDAR